MTEYNDQDDKEFDEDFLDSCLFWLGIMAGAIVIGGGIGYYFAINHLL